VALWASLFPASFTSSIEGWFMEIVSSFHMPTEMLTLTMIRFRLRDFSKLEHSVLRVNKICQWCLIINNNKMIDFKKGPQPKPFMIFARSTYLMDAYFLCR